MAISNSVPSVRSPTSLGQCCSRKEERSRKARYSIAAFPSPLKGEYFLFSNCTSVLSINKFLPGCFADRLASSRHFSYVKKVVRVVQETTLN